MDRPRQIIVGRAREMGLSLAELSLRCGRNHAYLQQFMKRGVPRNLPERVRYLVAREIGVEPGVLRGEDLPPLPSPPGVMEEYSHLHPTIPVYGHAMGGKDGAFPFNGVKIEDVLAPPSLARVEGAYAVYVVGTSMEPRYFPSETVFVHPHLPAARGDFVVAQIRASTEGDPPLAYVKRFVSRDEQRLRLEQFQPEKILDFPASRVISVHRIILAGRSEAGWA